MHDDATTLAFRALEPTRLLDAIDGTGRRTDGRIAALNSYENRVYAVGVEGADDPMLVAKFYRPGRWSDEAIREEHAFCRRLCEHELPVIAPLADEAGETLHHVDEFRFCLFPRVGGRPPELEDTSLLETLGRTVGRLHAVSRATPFRHRPAIEPLRLGRASMEFLVSHPLLPEANRAAYRSLAELLLTRVETEFAALDTLRPLPLHGDLHAGNLLIDRDGHPRLLDFDDTATGPAIQDLWMLLSGDRRDAEVQLGWLLDGYQEFHDFDTRELALIEPLRTLRIIHYAAWIARRWADDAFRQAFPFFDGPTFWDGHILSLKEQQSALDVPPLRY